MQVWARDPNRLRRGILPVLDAEAVLRETGVGTWAMTLDGSHPTAAAFDEGWGVIAVEDGRVLFSGPAVKDGITPAGDGKNIEITGVTDMHALADRRIYPNPAEPAEAQTAGYWTRIGSAFKVNDLMAALINRNAGPEALPYRQTPGLAAMAYGPGNGTNSTVHARFGVLLDEIQTLARAGGYVLDIRQPADSTDLVVDVREPVDRSRAVRFLESGGVENYALSHTAPTITTVLVAGQGEGAARTILERSNGTSWGGRRIEEFQDRRDTDETAKLEKAAADTLAENAATASAHFDVTEADGLRFGVNYHLGDIVTVAIGRHEITDGIRVANITWNEHARLVRLTVGAHSTEEERTPAGVAKIKKALKAIRHLEVTP